MSSEACKSAIRAHWTEFKQAMQFPPEAEDEWRLSRKFFEDKLYHDFWRARGVRDELYSLLEKVPKYWSSKGVKGSKLKEVVLLESAAMVVKVVHHRKNLFLSAMLGDNSVAVTDSDEMPEYENIEKFHRIMRKPFDPDYLTVEMILGTFPGQSAAWGQKVLERVTSDSLFSKYDRVASW